MKKNFFNTFLALFVASSLLFSGCAGMDKAQTGALVGGLYGTMAGQGIGRNTKSTLIGALVGLSLGYMAGNEMDKFDKENLLSTFNETPSRQTKKWINPDNGNQYAVTPKPEYTSLKTRQTCRSAEITAVIDGKQETARTTACLDRQGNWQLQK